MPNSVALIITTYNWVPALDLVLYSACHQSHPPNEIIIADDGSTDETKNLIQDYQKRYEKLNIVHAWQPDQGFRAAQSRNNAVRLANSEYLVFVDGDTILHPHFIQDHLSLAQQQTFTVGSRVLITKAATQAAFDAKKFEFNLIKTSANNKLNSLHIPCLTRLGYQAAIQPIEMLIFKVRSCNMGVWASDYIAINGFNEDFQGWGREDSEFALRLLRKGIAMRRIKFSAIQYHLFHEENDRAYVVANDTILAKTLASDSYQCTNGLETIE